MRSGKKLLLVGGQAVLEGVLMRSKENTAVAVRSGSGRIVRKEWKIASVTSKFPILKLPFIRGTVVLWETLVTGFKALTFSANVAGGKDAKGKDVLGKREMALSFALAALLTIGLFVVGPLLLAHLLAGGRTGLLNILDGFFRMAAFLAYLVAISFLSDVRRMFQYHGAEHMTIHAYEHGEKLLPKKIRKYPTMHPRCGTSFLLIVVFVSIIVFSVVSPAGFAWKLLSRILLLPVIAGVAYEILRLGAKFERNAVMRLIVLPGLLVQRITTKEPDDRQIEVAVESIKAVLKMGKG